MMNVKITLIIAEKYKSKVGYNYKQNYVLNFVLNYKKNR